MMLPPRPPLPPSGPPRGTYFSRRKLTAPAPPSPALTKILARSINIAIPGAKPGPDAPLGAGGEHGHLLASVAGPLEADHAVDERKQGVVAPHADVGSGEDRRPSLAKQNGAGVDLLPGARLHSQPLADAVASVACAACAFLVCHVLLLRGLFAFGRHF